LSKVGARSVKLLRVWELFTKEGRSSTYSKSRRSRSRSSICERLSRDFCIQRGLSWRGIYDRYSGSEELGLLDLKLGDLLNGFEVPLAQ
jgi:hypothetical protein